MALATVAQYMSAARQLLQDEVSPYRYSDDDLVLALNLAISEASRIRPELFQDYFGDDLPAYTSGSPGDTVVVDAAYRTAFLYYIVAHSQLADQEDTTDARTSTLFASFRAKLMGLEA